VSNPTSVLYRAFAEASAAELGAKDAMFPSQRERIAQLAQSARLPTMFGFREHVEVGGLISYGVDLRESWRRAANFVDRILRGAKANELPVEARIGNQSGYCHGLRLSRSFSRGQMR
jgi:ABC-type uncharacterized transport system substrate-binding protein